MVKCVLCLNLSSQLNSDESINTQYIQDITDLINEHFSFYFVFSKIAIFIFF